jgi:hypothetical protein
MDALESSLEDESLGLSDVQKSSAEISIGGNWRINQTV